MISAVCSRDATESKRCSNTLVMDPSLSQESDMSFAIEQFPSTDSTSESVDE